jgi:CBS-domain-containing membrane protein
MVRVATELMVWQRIQAERERGRAYQPRFEIPVVLLSWAGGLVAIAALGLISAWSHYPLVVAPFGASTVLLFGYPRSPLAQPRNIVLGNTLAALVSVGCVAALGRSPLSMGLAVGLTIALGQVMRCLHPPAGAVALLGVLLKAKPAFVLMPMLTGSLLLTLMAVLFSRLLQGAEPYPHHWF